MNDYRVSLTRNQVVTNSKILYHGEQDNAPFGSIKSTEFIV